VAPLPANEQHSSVALRGIFALVIVAAMYVAQDFLLPLVLAFFLALSFRPAVRLLEKAMIPPWLSAVMFVAVLAALSGLTLYLTIGPIAAWIDDMPRLSRLFSEKFGGMRDMLDQLANLNAKMLDAAVLPSESAVQEVVIHAPALPTLLALATGYPVQLAITVLATLVIAVFLLASGDLFYEKLVRVMPNLTDKKRALRIVYDIEHDVSAYVLTLIALNAGLGVSVGVTFYVLGMPSPHLWGILTFVLHFIPYVGAITGTALCAFMSVVVFDSLGYALIAPLAFVGLSLIESEIVSPLVFGRRLELNSVAILLSLAFWTWMWGVPGTILAVPVLVVLKVFCGHVEGLSGLGEFISARQVAPNGEALAATPWKAG
jgi:predicted PurR-regulated permease PerM